MKTVWVLGLLAGAAFLGWRTGGSLDNDALGMAAGILLGVGAAIPTAVILLAATKPRPTRPARRTGVQSGSRQHALQMGAPTGYATQPPVIVLAGAGMQPGGNGHYGTQQFGPHNAQMSGWGAPRPERRFKVVGEQEAWIDEW